MAEIVGIAASVVTLVNVSRKAADGISRLASLKYAPEVLLALNNEVVDLQCVIEDLSDLERQYKETLPDAINPSFYRTLKRTEEVLLDLEKLIAYKLTTTGDSGTSLRVDRSSWLQAHGKINQAQQQVRDCRISLSTAINLLISKTRQISLQIDTFTSVNAQYHQDLCDRLVGVNTQQNRLTDGSAGPELQLRDLYDISTLSKNDLSYVLEEPTLHRIYRLFGNSDAFRSVLATASSSQTNEVDVLGETILFKAVKSDDTESGE
ncbi:MAG: hypothetical protein Q9209_006967 [Squamulea sp. 1 TL-2023]